ncbi:class I SAM-dependent methyltransferase [Rufibacter roseus]|nr:methyltransferase domain-containing protein [Rufibacter roseus]
MLYWRVRGVVYAGNKVYCPLCETSFSTFLPFGVPERQQAMCPKCNTVERHRLLWLYLKHELHIETKPYKVLHMAPEPVLQDRLKQLPNLHYLSADLTAANAMQKVDLQQLPFSNASFDLILCSHVLGHVPDDLQAMRELSRVLTLKGLLLLQDHVYPNLAVTEEFPDSLTAQERYKLYGQPDRQRNYGQDFVERLEQQELQVKVVEYTPFTSEEECYKLGLAYRERLYLCSPKPRS